MGMARYLSQLLNSSGIVNHSKMPTGTVLQVVSTTKTDVFSSTSGGYVDVTGLSVSITPKFSTSKILVIANVNFGNDIGDGLVALARNSSTILGSGTTGLNQNGFAQVSGSYNNQSQTGSIIYLDSPATASATTYGIKAVTQSNTIYINRRGNNAAYGVSSQITVMEIAA